MPGTPWVIGGPKYRDECATRHSNDVSLRFGFTTPISALRREARPAAPGRSRMQSNAGSLSPQPGCSAGVPPALPDSAQGRLPAVPGTRLWQQRQCVGSRQASGQVPSLQRRPWTQCLLSPPCTRCVRGQERCFSHRLPSLTPSARGSRYREAIAGHRQPESHRRTRGRQGPGCVSQRRIHRYQQVDIARWLQAPIHRGTKQINRLDRVAKMVFQRETCSGYLACNRFGKAVRHG